MPRVLPSLPLGLLVAAVLLPAGAEASAATPSLTVGGVAGQRSAVASGAQLLAVATPVSGRRIRVTLRPTAGAGGRTRTLPARVDDVRRVVAAVDGAGATTVAWQGAGPVAYAATVDRRGRLLSPVSRVPFGPGMRLTGLDAGRTRTLLTASVPDLLQDGSDDYCRPPGGQFAGDTTFGSLKAARGRFARPTDTGTGDYPGGVAVVGSTAYVADGSGDLAALTSTRAPAHGRCTAWAARRTLTAAGIRSYAAIDVADDGSFAAAGIRAPGPFVGSGDEEDDPPTPAPHALRVVIQPPGQPARTSDLGEGTAPAVAATRASGAIVAWLDQPPAGAFGGGGAVAPTALLLTSIGPGGTAAGTPIEGMLADPARAEVPQVVVSASGDDAVLEAAGRYRLSRLDEGGRHPTQDLGPVTAGSTTQLVRAGNGIALLTRSAAGLTLTDVGSVPPA